MKNSLLKWYMLAFMLVSDFVVFAQDEPVSDGQGPGGTEGDDVPESPINGKLIWLAIVGIAFAYAYYVKTQKDKKAA